jgi:hypothetical protein
MSTTSEPGLLTGLNSDPESSLEPQPVANAVARSATTQTPPNISRMFEPSSCGRRSKFSKI